MQVIVMLFGIHASIILGFVVYRLLYKRNVMVAAVCMILTIFLGAWVCVWIAFYLLK